MLAVMTLVSHQESVVSRLEVTGMMTEGVDRYHLSGTLFDDGTASISDSTKQLCKHEVTGYTQPPA